MGPAGATRPASTESDRDAVVFVGVQVRAQHVRRAYPRGRGGAEERAAIMEFDGGLSPRTRGSRRLQHGRPARNGPIPADAGEPTSQPYSSAPRGAYPRGRGGAHPSRNRRMAQAGLSPRTRGSQDIADMQAGLNGPIPADAGEPHQCGQADQRRRAYPRGRGGAQNPLFGLGQGLGLSPRTRGSRQLGRPANCAPGPIPADAGEPTWSCVPVRTRRAYPRGRGGACGKGH